MTDGRRSKERSGEPDEPARSARAASAADEEAPGSATAQAESVESASDGDAGAAEGHPAGAADEAAADASGEEAEDSGDGADADDDPLARAEAERAKYLELAQRTQADFDNYRKRAARDVSAAGARARSDLLRELLPVVDNLERALTSAGEGADGLADGVRLVHSELVGVLERNGVEAIATEGERFDPTVHEALSTRSENGAEAGVVLDVVQKGYRLDQAVLRPARVVVSA